MVSPPSLLADCPVYPAPVESVAAKAPMGYGHSIALCVSSPHTALRGTWPPLGGAKRPQSPQGARARTKRGATCAAGRRSRGAQVVGPAGLAPPLSKTQSPCGQPAAGRRWPIHRGLDLVMHPSRGMGRFEGLAVALERFSAGRRLPSGQPLQQRQPRGLDRSARAGAAVHSGACTIAWGG